MGYSKQIYVGVYIECKNEFITDFRTTKMCRDLCTDEEQELHLNFCPFCGGELSERKIENGTKQKIQLDIPDWLEDVMYDINQQGSKIDKDIYVSNLEVGNLQSIELGNSGVEIFELSNLNFLSGPFDKSVKSKCYKEFVENEELNSFLNLCIRTYGDENVDLKFGVLVYYS